MHDEVWNFYEGAPLELITVNDEHICSTVLGASDGDYASVVPAGHYQGAQSTGDYTLVGCTVAPGFDFADFSFIEDQAMAQWLVTTEPRFKPFI